MKILFPFAFMAAAAASAAAPPAKPVGGATAAPSSTATRFPGVSDAGNAVLVKAQTTPDPQLQGLARQLKGVRHQLTSAVMAPTIDVDKVAGILRQQDTLQSQIRTQQTEHWITTIQQLPPEDRAVVLRTLLLSQSRSRQAAATPAQPSTPQP